MSQNSSEGQGKARFIRALKRFLPPVAEPLPPRPEMAQDAWTEFKIKQLEARQQWLQKILFLITLAVLAESLELSAEELGKLLALLP